MNGSHMRKGTGFPACALCFVCSDDAEHDGVHRPVYGGSDHRSVFLHAGVRLIYGLHVSEDALALDVHVHLLALQPVQRLLGCPGHASGSEDQHKNPVEAVVPADDGGIDVKKIDAIIKGWLL